MSWRSLVITSVIFSSWLAHAVYVDPAALDACPGYVAKNVEYLNNGSEVQVDLELGGEGCNVFGQDIERLRLSVAYETDTRLHVKIFDPENERYEVPESVFPRPAASSVPPSRSQLTFSFTSEPNPFSFTISRRSSGDVLFSTAGHPLIFEDQYLRVKTSSLPANANIYGLGEHTHDFRLNPDNNGQGLVRTLWSRDSYGIPTGTNLYGNHPIYYEHRSTGTHGVFLLNSNGMDVKLNQTTVSGSRRTTLEYNVIGGVLDFYFLAGSTTNPEDTAKQYSALVGLPAEVPYWGLGFHQCRFGYKDYVDVAGVIEKYKAAGIPLETMWTDIDYMEKRLVFTLDPQYFPLNRMREIVDHLHENDQHFIVMTDPAVGVLPAGQYGPFDRGEELSVWLKNGNGTNHLGVVWPGVTVFPDWFHPNAERYWSGEFERFYNAETGLNIDGAWIDMNEPASFCDFPCLDPWGEAVKQNMPPPRQHPAPAPDVPLFTGVISASDTAAPVKEEAPNAIPSEERVGATVDEPVDSLLTPPYAIDNAFGPISSRTAYTNVRHANGLLEYDTHNLYGTMMSTFTRHAMLARRPGRRPFIITRSTFSGAGKDVGKWLGDNVSSWEHYRNSIAQMLNFASIYGVPLVGSDVCGFVGDTTEDLCSRWALLGAFNPFFRNHNGDSSISQEFYVWPKTTEAAKAAIGIRYRLLDYLYTGLHTSHKTGSAVLSPLWFKYPKDTTTYPIDLQFFYGSSLLVSPVTEEGSNTVRYYLPRDTWYNFNNLAPVRSTGWITENDVTHTQIPLHIKGGSILPLRNSTAMTTTELRTRPFELVVAPNALGSATGSLYVDDGETIQPGDDQTTLINFNYVLRHLTVDGRYAFQNGVGFSKVSFLGIPLAPLAVFVDGKPISRSRFTHDRSRQVLEVSLEVDTLRKFTVVLV
ncbi:alpha-glucosidase [Coprinopsis marcescibilis]|uniref:beta-glucosidase n=1 Tax=Coprinopsis marcescibilis TaxID=230819 RepID=A0A5C3KVG0_COPMA|nr:alpha-glucosidase [Coprinopsis marcescibilis]